MATKRTIKQLLWFAGIWLISVAVLAVVAYSIKLVIMPAT